MRQLNKKQKKIIQEWVNENKNDNKLDIRKMPYSLYEEIEEIHDFETIYQEIDRYIDDLVLERIHGGK